MIYNLEVLLFVNEILALLGVFYFLHSIKKYSNYSADKVEIVVLLLILYGFSLIIYSILFFHVGSTYQIARTLPLWYSIFIFFVGIKIYKTTFHKTTGFFYKHYALFSLSTIAIGSVLSGFSAFPIFLYRHKNFIFLLILFSFFMSFNGGSTPVVIFLYLLFFSLTLKYPVLNKIVFNKVFVIVYLLFFFYILWIVYDYYSYFYIYGFESLDNNFDSNTLWRLFFWSYEFSEKLLPNFLFGIGFGTELFDKESYLTNFITNANPTDIDLPYTIGTHNSFLLLFIREGFIGFMLLFTLYSILFHRYHTYNFKNKKEVIALYLSFIFISISGLFNVILESPLYSGLYWALLGLFYQSMKENRIV